MTKKIKRLQLNTHGDKTATAEAIRIATEQNYDLALLTEPYCYKTKKDSFTIPSIGNLTLIADKSQKFSSCILVNNASIGILSLNNFTTTHVTALSIQRQDYETEVLLCVYSPPNKEALRKTIRNLQEILDIVGELPVVICGDFNSRSTLWYDRINDRSCQLLEEFILTNHLAILNQPNGPPTFQSLNGSSKVDLSLCSVSTIESITEWEVLDDQTVSDHRPIGFSLLNSIDHNQHHQEEKITDYGNLDLEQVGPALEDMCGGLIKKYPVLVAERTIDRALEEFYEKLMEILKPFAKRRKKFVDRPEWWTARVDNLRKTSKI
ncbi:hypothetical protein Zmor_004033 [Zophobas morio]|uniref:Endonuclease/exonuclease/phosphatase domain-containing protein n=1 Tax=Zophobas morio TaxID=2755281 RepID=A0AA38HKG3_9CUCU|nr:hypothetical protein Zmor_004033 [Zophobas morio]